MNLVLKKIVKNLIKNKSALIGFLIVFFFVFVGLLAPLLAPFDPNSMHEHLESLPVPPSWSQGGISQFLLGTDEIGRDLLSRLIYGARVSLVVGFLVVFVSSVIGSIIGLISGYYGGKVDLVIMRLTDVLMSLPSILLAIIVVTIFGFGLNNAIWAVVIISLPSFIRLVRASVLEEKKKEYVVACENFGAGDFRQAFLNIFRNCLNPLIVQGTLGFSQAILWVAALGFLGLGAQAPTSEWGTMLSESRQYFESAPWLVTLPGLCILLNCLGFNLFGDGLRDLLDPKST